MQVSFFERTVRRKSTPVGHFLDKIVSHEAFGCVKIRSSLIASPPLGRSWLSLDFLSRQSCTRTLALRCGTVLVKIVQDDATDVWWRWAQTAVRVDSRM